MSKLFLKSVEIENIGKFYDPVKISFTDSVCAISAPAGSGKSTFFKTLDYLINAIVEADVFCSNPNFCRTYYKNAKEEARIELEFEFTNSKSCVTLKYCICITYIGVKSEYLCVVNTDNYLFDRDGNSFGLCKSLTEYEDHVYDNITRKTPLLSVMCDCHSEYVRQLINFFKRIWYLRAGSVNSRLSANHLFRSDFFTDPKVREKCNSYMRLYDPNFVRIITSRGKKSVLVVRKNDEGQEYPVRLSEESDAFIKMLCFYRALDTLGKNGGLILFDMGDMCEPLPPFDSIGKKFQIIMSYDNDCLRALTGVKCAVWEDISKI
jgi:hypothetical protein